MNLEDTALNELLLLAELQLDTMLCSDSRGRMTTWNDAERSHAPWLFLLRTSRGNRWRIHSRLTDALAAELEVLCAAEPVTTDSDEEPRCATALRAALCTEVELVDEYRGPAFALPAGLAADPEVALDRQSLVATLHVDGVQAATCECARLGPRAAEAGVETRPEHRGRGFATRVVASWARAVQDSGRLALYSTWWRNAPSLALARKLGGRRYGEDFHLDGPRWSE